MLRIRKVTPKTGYDVELTLTDGTTRELSLLPYLNGPVFDAIRENPDVFRQVSVDDELGTIVWPNGADLDPDVLIHGLRPAGWPAPAIARDADEGPDRRDP